MSKFRNDNLKAILLAGAALSSGLHATGQSEFEPNDSGGYTLEAISVGVLTERNGSEFRQTWTDLTQRSNPKTIAVEVDPLGRPIIIDGPANGSQDAIFVEYSDDGFRKTISNSLGHEERFYYDEHGNIVRYIDANGVETVLTYPENQLRVATVTRAVGTPLESQIQFEYDGGGYYSRIRFSSGRAIETHMMTGASCILTPPASLALLMISKKQSLSRLYCQLTWCTKIKICR